MAIGTLAITETDIVAGQKVFASTELSRIAQIEAWANDEVKAKAVDLSSAQTISGAKNFSGGDNCIVKTQTAGNNTTKAASTAFVKAAVDAAAVTVPTIAAGAADSEGETTIGTLELKWGTKTLTSTAHTITYTTEGLTAFSTACVQVIVCSGHTANNQGYAPSVASLAKTGFTARSNTYTQTTPIRWFAIGY